MESVTQYFIDNLPAVVVVTVVAIVGLVFLVWWASKIWFQMKKASDEHSAILAKHDEKLDAMISMQSKVESLPCTQHSQLLEQQAETARSIEKMLANMESKIESKPCIQHSQMLEQQAETMRAIERTLSKLESKVESQPCTQHSQILERQEETIKSIEKTLSKLESKMDSMPCAAHSELIARNADKSEETSRVISRIEGQMTMLLSILIKPRQSEEEIPLTLEDSAFTAKCSPRKLNANGMKVAEIFKCFEFLEANKEWLISEVEKFVPKTALDVETTCRSVLSLISWDDRFNQLKHDVYHSPYIEITNSEGISKPKDITLGDVLLVISIPLRDAYLERHPEIIY